MNFDDFDRKMRVFETTTDLCALPGVFMVARLDGRNFTRLTKETCTFDVPFDERFRDLMVATADSLMNCGFQVSYAYTGSGKDNWLANHRDDELPVVSLDEIRKELKVDPTDDQGKVVQLAQERCREHLRSGNSFAFNATNILKQTRQRWIGLFHDYRARIEMVYVEPEFKRILAQNKQRKTPVPERVIRKLAAKIEPPTLAECHRLVLTS